VSGAQQETSSSRPLGGDEARALLLAGLPVTERRLELAAFSTAVLEGGAGPAAPTTLIWGRHDLATPVRIAEAASLRHGWPLHVIEDAADDPTIDQPEAFLNALRNALGEEGR
jgi:pimeloyl-ACP methyl ester carboxylesterase